jgi:Uncharacterized conserved protein (some members contain a von Willebrand factor type A (vWA) domain)
MWFIAILVSIFIVYLIQKRLYNADVFNGLEYNVRLSTEEVFVDEDIFLYEELTNNKNLPIPNAKIDMLLPDGMRYRLLESSAKSALRKDTYQQHMQSVFVLKSHQQISRRWRVTCTNRGVFNLGSVMMVTNDLFGFNPQSKQMDIEANKFNQIVVLPKIMDLDENFTSSFYHSGDVLVQRSLLSDPLRISGTRDYTPYDPMNRINWKSTAAHNKLMVNVEEYTQKNHFNIIMNMQARDIEANPEKPSVPEFIDLCITVCASIFDKLSSDNIPIRFITNTSPESVGYEPYTDEEPGSKLLVTEPFKGKHETIHALRLLAAIKYEISCPIERMLDTIIADPTAFTDSGNIVFVSTYLSERMIIFHDIMKRNNIRVIFYIMATTHNAVDIPDDLEVHYKNDL